MKVWTEIKRTPVTMAGWMLVGAAILPGLPLASGSCSLSEFLVNTVAGCIVAIVLRAVVVSVLPFKSER